MPNDFRRSASSQPNETLEQAQQFMQRIFQKERAPSIAKKRTWSVIENKSEKGRKGGLRRKKDEISIQVLLAHWIYELEGLYVVREALCISRLGVKMAGGLLWTKMTLSSICNMCQEV